jgi:hypothetical protein
MRTYLLWFVLGLVLTGGLALAFDHLPPRVVHALAVAFTGSTFAHLLMRVAGRIR